jgi:HPt (histidine-containing phosphotransfer) domain-containing protein
MRKLEARKPKGRFAVAAQAQVRIIEQPSTSEPAPVAQAIDLQHLSRMTLGDRGLEREVLALFDRQAEILLPRIRQGVPAAAASLAHTLKGSALGIGAWRVARAAEAVEQAKTGEIAAAVDALGTAICETKAAIASMLRAH